MLTNHFCFSGLCINFSNCPRLIPVAFKTQARLYVDGQRKCPNLSIRLLLLNVVASNPATLASPEHESPIRFATLTMPHHNSSCVINSPLFLFNDIITQIRFYSIYSSITRNMSLFYTWFNMFLKF